MRQTAKVGIQRPLDPRFRGGDDDGSFSSRPGIARLQSRTLISRMPWRPGAIHTRKERRPSPVTGVMTMDSYWAGLTEFLTSAPSGVGVSLAPRGVAAAIPALTPFEEWDRFQIINRVIVHKGLIGEIPNGLLESLFGTAQSSFANEVFVVYEITPTKDDHVRAVEAALAERAGGGGIRVSTEITPGGRKDA